MNPKRLAGIIGIVLMVPAWAVAGPANLGGSTVYASISGSSMQPVLKAGDLAVIRPAGRYETGDVVAYRSSAGDALMLHRVVSVDAGGRYTLKGDANDWLDSDRPTHDRTLGRLVLRIPAAGVLAASGGAGVAALVLAAASLVFTYLIRRRRARTSAAAGTAPVPAAPGRRDGSGAHRAPMSRATAAHAAFGAAAGAAVLAAISVAAFVMPVQASPPQTIAYTMQGAFTYDASVPRSAVYPGGKVSTGDPVFLGLVEKVAAGFDLEVTSDGRLDVSGSARMFLRVTDEGTKWTRTVALGAPSSFEGSVARISAPFDLHRLTRLLEQVEAATGSAPPHHRVDLSVEVAITGTLDGVPLSDTFQASAPFTINPRSLLPSVEVPAGATPADAPGFRATGSGSVRHPGDAVAATVFGVRVVPLRAAAVVGTLLLIALTLTYVRAWRAARPAAVPRRFEKMVVQARGADPAPWRAVAIEISSMDDLAWIAQQGARPILRDTHEGADRYEVRDGDLVYRYHAPSTALDETA